MAKVYVAILALAASMGFVRAERVNHEGRILGAVPVLTNAIQFNITNADAVLSALQITPVDSPWNEDISRRPLTTNSDAMIAQIYADASAPNKGAFRANYAQNFILVPTNQALVPITFLAYADESDPGPYPLS